MHESTKKELYKIHHDQLFGMSLETTFCGDVEVRTLNLLSLSAMLLPDMEGFDKFAAMIASHDEVGMLEWYEEIKVELRSRIEDELNDAIEDFYGECDE